MSSILDALKKLEQEKAEAAAPENARFDPDNAKYDLIGGKRAPSRGASVFVISGAILLASVVVGLIVGAALILSRSSNDPQPHLARVSTPSPPATSKKEEVALQNAEETPHKPELQPEANAAPAPAQKPQQPPEPAPAVSRPPEQKPEPVASPLPPPVPEPKPITKPAHQPAPEPEGVANADIQPAPEPKAGVKPARTTETKRETKTESVTKSSKSSQEPVTKPAQAPQPVEPEQTQAAKQEPEKAPEPAPESTAVAETQPEVSNLEQQPKEASEQEVRPDASAELNSREKAPSTAKQPASRNELEQAPTKKPSKPVDVMSFPALRMSDKARFGLDGVHVNMVRPASKTRPYASAIINLEPVQVGEKIPGSEAVLIGVESRAIGIEVQSTGERFHIRF